MKIKIQIRVDGVLRSLVLPLLSAAASHPSRSVAQLHCQLTGLRSQRRSECEFREWQPDAFFYLFVAVVAFWISWLSGAASSSLRGVATTGLCFWFLCFFPCCVNRVRLFLQYCWPNVMLNRKIALLQSEIERLQNEPPPDMLSLPVSNPPLRPSPVCFTGRVPLLSLWSVLIGCAIVGSLLPAASPIMAGIARLHINDKLQHFSAYLTLSGLPVLAFRNRRTSILAGLSMFFLGALLEGGQHFSPGRAVELGDVVANGAGVCCGLLFAVSIRSLLV